MIRCSPAKICSILSGAALVVISQSAGCTPRRLSRTQPPTTQHSSPAASRHLISSSGSGATTILLCIDNLLELQQVTVRVGKEEGVDREDRVALWLALGLDAQFSQPAILLIDLGAAFTV